MKIRLRRTATLAAAAVLGAGMLVRAAPSASAATYNDIVSAMGTAYGAFLQLARGDLSVGTATTRIVNAYNGVGTEIGTQLNAVAPISLRLCAQHAMANYARIPTMNTTELQGFARRNETCSGAIYDAFTESRVPATWDKRGFAGMIVGPIALLSWYRGYGKNTTYNALYSLVAFQVIAVEQRLEPRSCTANPLDGDAEPGEPVEIILRCVAYNGNVGLDSIWSGQPVDYTRAKRSAARNTSWLIADRVLPEYE